MAQNVTVAGASYPDVPSVVLPKTGGGSAAFVDTSDATAGAGQILSGYTAYGADGTKLTGNATAHATITDSYNSSTKAVTLTTDGVTDAWWGGINLEFLFECRWSKKLNEAENWPLTATTSAQNLLWKTSISTTEVANAVIDRWGKGYHSITTALDFSTYNYIFIEDAFVKYAYTSPEASLGKVHVCYDGLTYVYHWGERLRVTSGGAIVRPSTTDYGTFGSCSYAASLVGYRTAAGTFQSANNSTYGVSIGAIAPSQQSTSKKNPDYFNLRTPTFGIRAHNTYMPVASFSSLDAANTTCNVRWRVYRVPVEYGVYTILNERLLDMIQDSAFPAEPL